MGSARDHGRRPTDVDRCGTGDSLDEVFEVLSDSVRRRVLYHLHFADDGEVGLESLAVAVADTGLLDTDDPAVARETLERVHLPRLAAADLVAFDPHLGKVAYCRWPPLTEWLEHAAYTELPRSHPLLVRYESRLD